VNSSRRYAFILPACSTFVLMGAVDDCLTDIVKSLLEDGAEPIILVSLYVYLVVISIAYKN
jgi:hypothetical protein